MSCEEPINFGTFKKYECILNNKSESFENKVQSLIEVWKSIAELDVKQFDIRYVLQIIDWAKLHALNIVLTGEWRSMKEAYCTALLDTIDKAQSNLRTVNSGFSMRCQNLAHVVKKPWEHPVLTHLLHTKDAEIGSEEIEFFCVETAYLVSVRLKKLCENHCEDLALNLVTNFLACKKLSDGQNFNLNATETQLWFIFDIYIALLFKFQDKGKILQNFEELKLEEGYLLVKRFARKRVRISKIWRNCHKVAIFGSRFFLLRILMKYSESSEKLMKELLENILKIYIFLSNTEALLQQFVSTVRSITSVADAAGLCVLCEVIHLEAGSKIRHFAIEMYIRALTTDMNELEKLKHLNENEKVESTTSRLAQTFTNLSDLLKEHVNVSRECVLTAFSLEPTKARLQQIAELAKQSGFPVIDTGQEWKCQLHPPVLPTDDIAWMCSVCGDWMCKPQLNAPAMQTNTPLNEALQESVLGISEALCDDLAVCLSNPRYQVLSWLLPWTDLYRLCVMYLNNPEKTKNFVTELKYVDIDYSLFQHIKKEPVDEFTGIEKGYEQYLDLNFVSDEEEISSISEDSSQDRALSLGSDGSEDPYYVPQRKSDPKTLKSLRMFRPTIKRKATESESEISEKHFKIDSEQTQSQATTSDSLASTYTLSELLSSSEGASWQKNNSSTLKGSKNGIVATLPPTGGQVAVNSSTSAPRTIKDSTRIELLQLLRNRTNGTNENNENSGSNFNIETNRDSLLSTKQIFAKMVALHNSEDNNQSEPTQPKTMHTISQSTRNYVSKWIQEKWSSCASLQPTVVVTDILASGEYQRWCKPHPPIPPMKELRVSLTKLSEEEIQRLTSPSKKQLDSPEENKVDLVKTVMCKELTVRLTNHIPSAAPAPKEVLEKDELPIVQDSNKITPITEPPNLVDCYNSQYGTSLEDSELEIAKTLAMLEQHTLEAVAKEQMASKAILFNNSKQEPFSMQTITENPTLPMEPDLMDLSNPLVIPDLMDTIQEINHNQIMANQTSVYLPPPQLSLEMEIMPLATLDQVGPLEINTTQNIVSNPSPLEVENQESNSIQEAETPTQTISLKTLEELVFQTSQEITRSQQAILNQSCLTKSESVEPQYKEATQDSQSKHSEHPECRMQRVERIKDTMSMCLEKLETLSAQLNSSQALASTEEIPNQEIQLNQETSEPLETLAQKQIPNPELLERTIAEEPTNKPKLTMEATEHLETVTPQVKQEETCKLEAQLPPKQLPQEHSVMLKPQVKQEEIPNSEFPERTILEQQEVITPQIKQEVISSLEALLRMQEIKQEEVPQHEQAANSQDYLPMVQTIKKEDTCNLETQSPQAAMSSVQLLVREIKEEDVSDQEEIIQMNLLPLELTQWRETIERVPETQSDQERLLFRESLSPEEPKQMLDQEISYPMESIIHKMQEFHLQEHFEKHPKILELNEKAILNPTSQLSLQMPEMTLEAQESDQPEKPLPLDTLEPLETILKPEECNQVEIPQQESQLPLEMPEATQEELFNQETQSYPVETFNLAIQEHKQEEIPHQEPQVSMEITETNQETVVEVFNQELQAPVEILDHIETLIPKSDNSNQVELQQEPHSPMQIIEMEESKEKEMSKQEEHLPLDLVAPIQTLISQSEEFSQVETHPQEAALQLELPEIIQEVEESKEMNIQSPETPLHLEKEDQVQPVTLEAKESNQVETPYQQPHSPLEMPSTIQETEETKEVKFYLEAPIPQEILSPVDPVILEVEESLQVQTPLPETEESHQVETSNQKTEEPLQVETPHQETEQPHSPLEIPIAIQETEEIKEVKFNLEAPIPQELSSPLDPVVLEVKESLRVETPLPETEELHQQPHSPLEMPTTIQGTEETKEANFNVEAPIPQELLSPADPVEESLQVETPLLEAEEPHQVETANQKTQEPLQVETPHQETEELHQVENQQPHSPLETIQETEETKEVNSNLEAPVPQEFSSPVDPVILDVEESLKVETLLLETEESHQVETFNQKTEEPLQVETPHQETEELHQVETQQPRSPLEIPISILETEETKEANLNLEAPIPREILSPVDPVILKVEESLQVETPLLETEESHQVETFNQKTEEPLQVDTPLQETEELHQVETQEAHLPLEISEPNPEMEESMEVITANQETQLPLEILDSIQSVTLETEESKQGEESPPQEIPLETVEKMEQTEESSPQAPIPLETLDPVQPVILETEFNQVETLQEKSCSIPEITETKEIETSNLESQLPLETSDTVKTLVPIVEACNQVEPQHLEPQLPLEISETIKETVEFQEEIKLQLTPVEMPQQESSQLPLETIQELPDSNKTEMLSPGTALALKDLDPVAVSQEAVESCQLESEIISEKLTLNEENLEIKETNISNQEILLEPVGTTIPECKQLPLECPSQETELVEIPPLIQELPENKQVQEECCTQQSQLTLETLEPAEIIIQENKSPQISELSLPTANQITTIIQETQKSVQEELSNQQETESSVVQIEEIQKQEIICNKEKFETLTQEETPIQQLETPMSPILTSIRERLSMCSYPNLPPKLEELKMALEIPIKKESRSPIGTVEKMEYLENQETSATLDCQTVARRKHKLEEEIPLMECSRKIVKGQIKVETEVQDMVCPLKNVERVSSSLNGQEESQSSSLENVPSLATQAEDNSGVDNSVEAENNCDSELSKGAAELLVKEDIGLADTLVINGDECFNVVEEVIEHIPDVKDDSKKRVKKEIVNIYEDDYEMDDFKIDMAKDDSGGVIESFEQFLKSLNKEEKTVDNYKEIPKKSIGYIDDEIFCDLTDYKSEEEFFNISNTNEDSFGFYKYMDDLEKHYKVEDPLPKKNLKIYKNSHKIQHWNVPCFKVDYDNEMQHSSENSDDPNSVCVTCRKVHLNTGDHKIKDLRVMLQRMSTRRKHLEESNILKEKCKRTTKYVMCHCCASPKKRKNTNKSERHYKRRKLSKKISPLLDKNKKESDELAKPLNQNCEKKTYVKKVLKDVPGMKDFDLVSPTNRNHIINVVQVSNSRATSQNTQTSTQISPHIQRIGQPRVVEQKPETSEASTETSTALDTATTSTVTTARPLPTQPSTLINILSQQIIRPGQNAVRRQAPLINILSQQIIRPGQQGQVAQKVAATTDSSVPPQNNALKPESTTSEVISQQVDTTAKTVPSTAAKVSNTVTTNQGGTILQFICKSSLPKFQQAFGKAVFTSTSSESETTSSTTNTTVVETATNATNTEVKKVIPTKTVPVNVQPIQGNVIYRGQMPVGQTISIIPSGSTTRQLFRITGSTHEQISLVKESVIQNKMNVSALLAAALQGKPKTSEQNGEIIEEVPARITLCRPGTQNTARIVKPVQLQIPTNVIRSPQPNMSSTTLEQLREFDMVYKQIKERSCNTSQVEPSASNTPETPEQSPPQQRISFTYVNQTAAQAPVLNVSSQSTSSPTPCPTQASVTSLPKIVSKPSKGKSLKNVVPNNAAKAAPTLPKPQQKTQEDEHTTQRIFDILAEYAEQLRNSPDLNNKPAPRRRSTAVTNPNSSSKRKKSSSGSKKVSNRVNNSVELEPEELTMGSEDSSGGNVVQLSVTDDEQSQATNVSSTPPEPTNEPAPTQRQVILAEGSNTQPSRNVILADSTVGEALKMPNTALIVPGSYIMPVSMVKGAQQIAVVSGGSKILATVPARSGQNMLLFQSFVNQNRKGAISAVKYSAIQPITGISSQSIAGVSAQPPVILPSNSVATAVALGQPITLKKVDDAERSTNTELLLTISQPRDVGCKQEDNSPEMAQPDSSTSLSSDSIEIKVEDVVDSSSGEKVYSFEKGNAVATSVISSCIKEEMEEQATENVMSGNITQTGVKEEENAGNGERIQSVLVNASTSNGPMLSHTHTRYRKPSDSVDNTNTAAKEEFVHNGEKATTSESKIFKGNTVYYAIKAKRPVNKKLESELQKQAALERELRLQKSLSEECEDLGVDEPSTSDLFPEADLLFDSNHSPSYDQISQDTLKRTSQATTSSAPVGEIKVEQKAGMNLFSDDDENSSSLRADLFDYVEYHSVDNALTYQSQQIINGNNASNESASSCEDNTLLPNCSTMSEVTLNSPISPEMYSDNTQPTLNKYKYKYTNRKKGERLKTENWPTEVSSSEDTVVATDATKPTSKSDTTAQDEACHDNFKVVRVPMAKESEDVSSDESKRGNRRSTRKPSCCNGSKSANVTTFAPPSKKRPIQQQTPAPTPHKKTFFNKKR